MEDRNKKFGMGETSGQEGQKGASTTKNAGKSETSEYGYNDQKGAKSETVGSTGMGSTNRENQGNKSAQSGRSEDQE